MNLEPDGDLATFDGSHDGVRTRASPKLIIAPKSAELALRLAARCVEFPISLRRERGIEGRRAHGTERGLWTRNETMVV